MYIVTAVIRFHLSILICWLFTWGTGAPGSFSSIFGPIFDFLFPILVGVMLALTSDAMYQYVATHRSSYEKLVDYLMTNYSRDNIVIWKRLMLVGLCCYIFLVTAIIAIDNWLIFISTVETAISFIICDVIENREKIRKKLFDLGLRPKIGNLADKFPIFNDKAQDFPFMITCPIPHRPGLPPDNFPRGSHLFNVPLINDASLSNEEFLDQISPPISPKPPTPPQVILDDDKVDLENKSKTPPISKFLPKTPPTSRIFPKTPPISKFLPKTSTISRIFPKTSRRIIPKTQSKILPKIQSKILPKIQSKILPKIALETSFDIPSEMSPKTALETRPKTPLLNSVSEVSPKIASETSTEDTSENIRQDERNDVLKKSESLKIDQNSLESLSPKPNTPPTIRRSSSQDE
ncbi:Hypothetical protein HVR_LOCUS610 [uncultured virus]|nr:Hypothetical protein HVR_LOCUS610 [uncultured virus]